MEQALGHLRFSLTSTDDLLARVVEDYSETGKDAFDEPAARLPVFGRDAPCVGQAIALRPRVVRVQHVLVASGDPGAA